MSDERQETVADNVSAKHQFREVAKMNIILNLTIKRLWFDMIVSGDKREEYRDLGNKQVSRAFAISRCDHKADGVMVLRNGYNMDSRALAVRILVIEKCMTSIPEHTEWGEPNSPHFSIVLGDIIHRGTYAEVKDWLEKRD